MGKADGTEFTCGKCWSWTLQILVWGSLVWAIIGGIFVSSAGVGVYLPFTILYVIYWINMFCSQTCSYLSHKKDGNNIYGYMGQLFYTPAFVDFHISCYHYETRSHHYKDSEGRDQWRTEQVKVHTYSETQSFKYMTWRDVSGAFNLNTSGFARDPKLAMVKLRIHFDIEFANDGTVNDFEAQKNYFISRNRFRDTHYDFTQSNRLDGYSEFNLVNIGEQANPSIGMCWLLLATFLTVSEFYKNFVDSYCIRQDFKILKIVSTRQNLNLQEVFQPYIARVPQIIVMQTTITFNDPSKLGAVTVVPDLPDLDEINNTPTPGSGGMTTSNDAMQGGGMTSSTNAMQGGGMTSSTNAMQGGGMTTSIDASNQPFIQK